MKLLVLLILLSFFIGSLNCQLTFNCVIKNQKSLKFQSSLVANDLTFGGHRSKDTYNHRKWRNFILPSTFLVYGAAINVIPTFKNTDLEVREMVLSNFHRKYHIDDWFQYAPMVSVFGLEVFGVKGRHKLLDKTLITASSALFMAGIVNGVKYSTKILRPDNSSRNSFPSGHTATVFFGAHILYKEYKDTKPWIGVAGYALATTTAIFRVINNRHWLSDIVGGAGVAIISVELGYLLLPTVKKWLHFDQPKVKRLIPASLPNHFGSWQMNYGEIGC